LPLLLQKPGVHDGCLHRCADYGVFRRMVPDTCQTSSSSNVPAVLSSFFYQSLCLVPVLSNQPQSLPFFCRL
jgi:hypothetical protein